MIETKMKLERQKEEEFTEMAGDIVVLQNEKIIQTKGQRYTHMLHL